MKSAPFSYRAATSATDAAEHLASETPPKILAGGQSLVPMLNLRLAPADALLDLSRIPELRAIEETPEALRYGALTTHAAFEDGLVPDATNGLMRHAAGKIAYRAVRTRGTIGGAIALADPAADWVTVTFALDATLHLMSAAGKRRLSVREFVLGPYFTALNDGEFIEAVEVRRRPVTERWGHSKVVVKTGEYAESMAIALLDASSRTSCVVLGATDGAPVLMAETAAAFLGGSGEKTLKDAMATDLARSERDFSAAKRILHTTTVLRAMKDASAS